MPVVGAVDFKSTASTSSATPTCATIPVMTKKVKRSHGHDPMPKRKPRLINADSWLKRPKWRRVNPLFALFVAEGLTKLKERDRTRNHGHGDQKRKGVRRANLG